MNVFFGKERKNICRFFRTFSLIFAIVFCLQILTTFSFAAEPVNESEENETTVVSDEPDDSEIIFGSNVSVHEGIEKLRDLFHEDCNTESKVNYQYFEPENPVNENGYPLIVFCHGLFHGYTNHSHLVLSGMPNMASSEMQSKFIEGGAYIFMPQLSDFRFNDSLSKKLQTAVESFVSNHNVNRNKIYIFGSSAGGNTALHMMFNAPGYYAKALIANSTGFPSASQFEAIKDTPIWQITSLLDPMVFYPFQARIWNNITATTAVPESCRKTTFTGSVYSPNGALALCPHFTSKVFTFNFEMINPEKLSGSAKYDGVNYPGTETVTAGGTNVATTGIIEWLQE